MKILNLSFSSSLTCLILSGNSFERIPATIKQLSNLRKIDISYCQRLISLPELPSSVFRLRADNCTSLEQIWALKQLVFESEGTEKHFNLWNCLKLDEDECQEVAHLLLRYHKPRFTNCMDYPGSRIPEWVKYQSMGDSVEVPNPSRWLNRCLLEVAFYVCVKSLGNPLHVGMFNLTCDSYFGDNSHVSSRGSVIYKWGFEDPVKEHVMVGFHQILLHSIYGHGYSLGDRALLKFSVKYYSESPNMKTSFIWL